MVLLRTKSAVGWLSLLLLLAAHSLHAAVREIATVSTSWGDMEFALFSDVSPRAVANFKYLADTSFYDNTAFHRHIQGFMVQGGDPLTRGTTVAGYNRDFASYGTGGPEYTIPNEPTIQADRGHVRGVLSMAKTGAPDSGGSQFFILFGTASHLDNVHAPMGTMIKGEEVLQKIEAQPKDANDLPLAPIVIHSVRVRAEHTEGTAASKMSFQPATLGGLLRRTDRNQDVCGSYQLTVTSAGAFSAQVQYYGRRNAFSGGMRQGTLAVSEADYVGTLDSTKPVPLRVRIRARKTANATTSIVLRVGGVNADGTDLVDDSLGVAAGEVIQRPPLAERYTAAFTAPVVASGTADAVPRYPDLKGSGYLAFGIRPLTGLAVVTGRLPDNTSMTFSRPVSNEGGRYVLPLYFHEMQPEIEKQRALFPSVSLAGWSSGLFSFNHFRFRMVGALELPPKPGLPQPANVSGSSLIWYREAKRTGPVRSQIATYLPVATAAWTPPARGQTLSPFAAAAKAQFLANSVGVGKFLISKTNMAGIFDSAATAPQLRFSTTDGTFQGSFIDTALPSKPRRTVQGVLLQKEGISKGVGFYMTDTGSLPVLVTP
jgi:peptidyl-prolyl cis-trans isomerase B (cyclophilin B)